TVQRTVTLGVACTGHVENGIDRLRAPQMARAVADVVCRKQPFGSHLPLNTQVPLTDAHVRSVVIHCRHERVQLPRYILRRRSAGRNEAGVSTGIVHPRILETHAGQLRPDGKWWCRQVAEVSRRRTVIEDPGGSSNRRTAIS